MTDSRGRYSVVRHDSTPAKQAEDAADARAFAGEVRVHYGGARVAIPAALVAALASALGTYYTTHGGAVECATRGDFNALQKQVSEVAATVSAMSVTVARNADAAHNESVMLATTVGSNARDATATVKQLESKLDLFMSLQRAGQQQPQK